jgi:predicted nuclease with TOPRIM domain
MNRERESHTTHLKNMEAELDAQVARIEKQEREKARLETEFEKRELQDKLETELDELKAQLKLFQKVYVPPRLMAAVLKQNCVLWYFMGKL